MKRYPAFYTAIAFIAGVVLSSLADISLILSLFLTAVMVGVALFSYFKLKAFFVSVFLILAIVAAGFIRAEIPQQTVPRNNIRFLMNPLENQKVRGYIVSEPEVRGERTTFELKTRFLYGNNSWIPTSGKLKVTVLGDRGWLEYGDYLEINSKIKPPLKNSNFNAFDYEKYLHRHGIYGQVFLYNTSELEVLEKDQGSIFLSHIVQPIRNRIKYTIWNTLKGNHAALLEGMLLGRGRKLPHEIKEYFSNTGVIHILAVSGLHVGILALVFLILFKAAFQLNQKWATILTILVLFIYMFVCNLRPSITRAWIMYGVIMLGFLMERKVNLLNNIGFAALLILLFSPSRLFHIGFQLSFLAVGGIALLYPRFDEYLRGKLKNTDHWWQKGLKYIASGFFVSFSVVIFTTPIVMHYFHKFQLISPLANLFVIPAVFFVISLGVASVLGGLISIVLAKIFAAANWLFISYLLWIVGFFARQPWAFIPVQSPTPLFFILWYAIVLFICVDGYKYVKQFYYISKKTAIPLYSITGIAIITLLICVNRPSEPKLTILFFDVGQGDSALLRFPDGKYMLIDGGIAGNYSFVQQPYLWAQGSLWKGLYNGIVKAEWGTTIHTLIGSHPQSDHIGSFPSILEDFTVKKVYDIGAGYPSPVYLKYLRKIKEKGIDFKVLKAGDRITDFQDAIIEILHPDSNFVNNSGEYFYDINEASFVLKITYRKASFLFTGDIGKLAEFYLTSNAGDNLAADLIKIPHHGSRTSSSASFLSLVNPQAAVISVGRANRFKHPSPEVIARLDSLQIPVYRTDHDGAIMVTTDGDKIWIESKLDGPLAVLEAARE
ncbi:DNA internalization-related competence protein ComEC/Rec2 [bacterium]|nr:DNA internalization-related competence protein ComEC/Rec2 [bacterium]